MTSVNFRQNMKESTNLKLLFFVLLFLGLTQIASAQNAEIRGFVYDKNTGEPILFTNVILEGTGLGAATNIDGFYSISRLKPGSYTLVCTYLGYDTASSTISVKKGEILNHNIYLTPGALQLREFKVSDKKIVRQTQVKVSKIKITPGEMQKLPTIGATPDLAQYLQILPGVVSTGDKGGQIYIRGGTPVQNKVLLDGMTIFNPFHSIGLFSVFDNDIIKNVDVYGGGFDAEFGDRISAVMDIKTIDGNKKRLSGNAGISPFVSSLNLNGPLKKFEEGSSSSTFVLSIRNSSLDKTGPALYNYADSNGLPYSFTDLYGKVSWQSAEGSKFSLFGFNYSDKVDFKDITTYQWNASGIGSQFLLVPQASSTIISGHFSFSGYRIDQSQADDKPRYSAIKGFEGGMTFTYYLGQDQFRYGFELSGMQTQFQYYNAAGRRIGGEDNALNTTNIAGFFKYRKVIDNLIIEPSFRIHRYGDLQETSLEPRLGVKYNATEFLRFKFAGGYYSQSFISAFSDRDVVNYFYGFLLAPSYIPTEFNGEDINTRLQKARHAIIGIELDIKDHSLINIEGYYKSFDQLTNINRNKIFDDNSSFKDEPDYLKSDFIVEQGTAYGVNFHYTYEKSPFYIWVVYDLAYVDRYYIDKYGDLARYLPNWDRRHNVQLLASVKLSHKNPWEISFRWNYGSSLPFTQTQGFYEYIDFNGGINEDYTKTNGALQILYAEELNGGRLPQYHRLDISIKKTYNLKQNRTFELNGSIINAYNRKNVFYYDRYTNTTVYQLPIMPSLGLSYHF